MTKLCPHCQRPMADSMIVLTLPDVKRRIYQAVANAGEFGIDKWGIMDKVYGDDPDGGAVCDKIIKAHIWAINKRIAEHGVRIVGKRGHAFKEGAMYRLEQLPCAGN